ncbi:hypothetical protein ACEF17_10605 [Streptococcus hyovaginalis]|uniref:hypothetical protein n=1 Tax=Bacillaceae TaxID=186817 RepID=UPI0009D5B72F|nr:MULTISPECIES: hypothetical protein [Bacillaceae]MDU1845963.1 hypothetical protein [Niallia nealsonii]SLL35283.1 Uncharacterised protein [Mycobacteroides abscessus subsp. abscessus]HEO8421593.1 hypothetical protein [Yersinia enterocolitica]KAB7670289.1 hypothetical protein F9279_08470 [Bacillus sp. B1-b2]MED3794462.1 hypothetical protein [Niallia alba]
MKGTSKLRFSFLILSLVIILSGCSSSSKANIKVTEDNIDYLIEYDESLQTFITEMTSILTNFNNSLDGLYTHEVSNSQFATIMKETIKKSNELVSNVEALDVNPELFEAHQNLIVLVNRSHQLLLTAIESANNSSTDESNTMDKDTLRQEYIEIKKEQANTANQWKILREELASAAMEEEK